MGWQHCEKQACLLTFISPDGKKNFFIHFFNFWVAFWANSYYWFSSDVDVVMIIRKTFTKVFKCEGINNLYAIAAITKITGTFIDCCIHYLFLISFIEAG